MEATLEDLFGAAEAAAFRAGLDELTDAQLYELLAAVGDGATVEPVAAS